MKSPYVENEIKILDVDVSRICSLLDSLNAQKVYDDVREITSYDHVDQRPSLREQGVHLKITNEGKTKMSLDQVADDGRIISIKNKLGRQEEMTDTLRVLGIKPIAFVRARRISYELDGVDIDIDTFPHIPPFVEIDGETGSAIGSVAHSLGLGSSQKFVGSTIRVFESYGLDYFVLFQV